MILLIKEVLWWWIRFYSWAMKYIPLNLGRLSPYLHWIPDEQNPYAALPTDPVLFSHGTLLSAITASSPQISYVKLISIIGSILVSESRLIQTGEIQTSQSTFIMPQLLKLVAPFQIQRTVDTIKASSSSVWPLAFHEPKCDGGFSSPCIYCSFCLCFYTAFVATSFLNQALGIWDMGSMSRFSCMVKLMKISWCPW